MHRIDENINATKNPNLKFTKLIAKDTKTETKIATIKFSIFHSFFCTNP
jgi:hypothetical protein